MPLPHPAVSPSPPHPHIHTPATRRTRLNGHQGARLAVPPKEAGKRLRGTGTLLHWKKAGSGSTVPLLFKTLGSPGQGSVCRQGYSFGSQVTMPCVWLVRSKPKTKPSDRSPQFPWPKDTVSHSSGDPCTPGLSSAFVPSRHSSTRALIAKPSHIDLHSSCREASISYHAHHQPGPEASTGSLQFLRTHLARRCVLFEYTLHLMF